MLPTYTAQQTDFCIWTEEFRDLEQFWKHQSSAFTDSQHINEVNWQEMTDLIVNNSYGYWVPVWSHFGLESEMWQK